MLEMLQDSTVLFASADASKKGQLFQMVKSFGFGSMPLAKNQQEAYDLLRFNRLALIIADYQSEHIDGLELVRTIRSNDTANKEVPIILIATESDGVSQESGIEVGASAIVQLPINVKTFYKTITAVLNNVSENVSAPNYAGPNRRNLKNQRTPYEDRRTGQEDIPSPLIDEISKRTGS